MRFFLFGDSLRGLLWTQLVRKYRNGTNIQNEDDDRELTDEELETVVGGAREVKILFENWRGYLKEEDYNPKVNELLCQVMEAMYGEDIPLTLITFGDPNSKDKKQFVAVKGGRSDRMETCVVQYQGPSTMDALKAKGLGYGGGYDEPTGIPLEEDDE